MRPIDPAQVVRGQYDGLPLRARRRSAVGASRPSSPSRARSTTGAGPASRSTCGPASGWPRARGSSRSPSASRRRACSPRGSGSASYGPDHLTFDLDESSRGSRCRSTASGRGRGWCSRRRACSSRATRPTGRGDTLEAYERLIRDAMAGDHTLFTTADGHRAALGGLGAAAREPAAGRARTRRAPGARPSR